jgi:hypothetical protein
MKQRTDEGINRRDLKKLTNPPQQKFPTKGKEMELPKKARRWSIILETSF